MLCTTLLTLSFVSAANVYSEESYIVDVAQNPATQSVDCQINTMNVLSESKVMWEASDKDVAQWLKKYNIVMTEKQLSNLDSFDVRQEWVADVDVP